MQQGLQTSKVLLRATGSCSALRQMSATSAQLMPCVMRSPCHRVLEGQLRVVLRVTSGWFSGSARALHDTLPLPGLPHGQVWPRAPMCAYYARKALKNLATHWGFPQTATLNARVPDLAGGWLHIGGSRKPQLSMPESLILQAGAHLAFVFDRSMDNKGDTNLVEHERLVAARLLHERPRPHHRVP